jgi:hypothetical protein
MINIFDLNKNRDEKEISKYKTYREVLKKCHSKIKLVSKDSYTNCCYIIPKLVIGLPKYDQILCAEYCVEKLRKNGFVVVYTYPNLLYISWEHVPSSLKNPEVKSIQYEIQSNPYKDYSKIIYNLKDTPKPFNEQLLLPYSKNDTSSITSNQYFKNV